MIDAGAKAKILKADLGNIVRKVKAGKPLSDAERKIIEASAEPPAGKKAAAPDPEAVLRQNVQNIVAKAAAGKTLTAAEIKLLREFQEEHQAPPAAAAPAPAEWVSSDQILGAHFGHHRASFPRWRKQYPDAPRPRANGEHNVKAWRDWFEKHPELRTENAGDEKEQLQLEQLRQKCRRITFDNDLREGAYVHRDLLADHLGRFGGESVSILRQKLENEFPAAVAGLTPPQVREMAKGLIDEILAKFRAHFETWTI
jgi:hypothetical protein